MRRNALLALVVFWVLPVVGQTMTEKVGDSPWRSIQFLLGKWTASASEKGSPLGAGQGGFSFEPELNQKIIVRRNFAVYDSGNRHDDLLVIYLDAPTNTPRAIFFDSEGHVIRYNLNLAAPSRVIFESEASQPGPRYRLSYWLDGDLLDGRFEIAPPGGEYKTYLSWTSKKN